MIDSVLCVLGVLGGRASQPESTYRPPMIPPMMSRRFLLAGLAAALGLAGCKNGSLPANDAALSDGPAAPETSRSDLNADSIAASGNDGPVAVPDLPAAPDTNDEAVPADVRLNDIVPAPDGPAAEAPAVDKPASETPAAERPGVDPSMDGSRAEAPAPDGAARDTSGDAGCTGWTTVKHLQPAEVAS